jgi:hypothetical protein
MHVRRHIPHLKLVSLDTVLLKFRIAQLQLYVAQLRGFVAPIAVRSSATNHEWFLATSKILIVGQLVPLHAERLVLAGTVFHDLLHPVAVAVVLIAVMNNFGLPAGEAGP